MEIINIKILYFEYCGKFKFDINQSYASVVKDMVAWQ